MCYRQNIPEMNRQQLPDSRPESWAEKWLAARFAEAGKLCGHASVDRS